MQRSDNHPFNFENLEKPLKICLLSYRSQPHCGGQGVYVRNLSQALCRLGHKVDVVSGPPYPDLENGARLQRLPSLDLYNPENLFRTPTIQELFDPINLVEWLGVSTMGFPEPLTFGMRAQRLLNRIGRRYDIIHDNQSLSYGVRTIARHLPTVATIHHPITVDRKISIQAETNILKKLQQWRWYSFIHMQKRVAPVLKGIITVSKATSEHICREFGIGANKLSVVPNGIDTRKFHPLPDVARIPGRIIATTSADTPLKGLKYLLRALAGLAPNRPELQLIVVGRLKKNSPVQNLIADLDLSRRISFTGQIDHNEYVRQYAMASMAVIPSLYEGFGLPAGEAMACGVPVISTSGGALPEVVGNAGMLVPPADSRALGKAISLLLDNPEYARTLGQAGFDRVRTHFTWEQAARKTAAAYYRAIHDNG
jgi:glycosyltransferase involved in cell wall biosynthesis